MVAPGAGAKAEGSLESRLLSGGVGAAPPLRLDLLCVTHPSRASIRISPPYRFPCPNMTGWLRGECEEHSKVRYLQMPCGKRGCEGCGALRRWRAKERIELGVEKWGAENCAFMVLTFDDPRAENPRFKKEANRRKNAFIKWLRTSRGMPFLEVVTGYELTKRGRLHINLVLGNWKFTPKAVLWARWGAFVDVSQVGNASRVGVEVAKAHSVERLAAYITKAAQAVPPEWGRAFTFSQMLRDKETGEVVRPGWPKLPKEGPARVGSIAWMPASEAQIAVLGMMQERGIAREVKPGEWSVGESCECFLRSRSSRSPPTVLVENAPGLP